MEELRVLVTQAQIGDHHAYGAIVQRFQDMAVGYSYALLGDIDLAEDVAQEAFINAFYKLSSLRDPAAFPGWFRRIVFTQVNRLKRRNEVPTISLDAAPDLASRGQHFDVSDPAKVIEKQEMRDQVFAAIAALPDAQREVVTLFYISAYSQKEVSAFLSVPVSTVKMRLHYARKGLKERMIKMIENNLLEQRPSKDDTFVRKVMNLNDRIIEVDKALRHAIGEAIDLEITLTPTPWLINIDPARAEEVVTNLVANARDAMLHGGQLTIETANVTLDNHDVPPNFGEYPGDYILLTVSDTGHGISGDVLPYIFESSPGLATVREFVEQNRGYIWVCSEEESGTTFQIYLSRSGETETFQPK